MARPTIYGWQPYGNGKARLIRSVGPHAFDVVRTSLHPKVAERLCERANRLLAVLRGSHKRPGATPFTTRGIQ